MIWAFFEHSDILSYDVILPEFLHFQPRHDTNSKDFDKKKSAVIEKYIFS